jgi:hypothetical protein
MEQWMSKGGIVPVAKELRTDVTTAERKMMKLGGVLYSIYVYFTISVRCVTDSRVPVEDARCR